MLAPGFELERAATQLEAGLSCCLVLNSMPLAKTFLFYHWNNPNKYWLAV